MKPANRLFETTSVFVLFFASSLGQAQNQTAAPPPTVDTIATEIPGVVKAGAKIHAIKDGFQGTEGPLALPDGSVVFCETIADRLVRIDRSTELDLISPETLGIVR
jgi:hypothetical protein